MKEQFDNLQFKLDYLSNNKLNQVIFTDGFENEQVEADYSLVHHALHTELKLKLVSKTPIIIQSLSLHMEFNFEPNDRIFVNGYQSWTDSKEFFIDEKMKTLSFLAKPLVNKYQFDKYGDYTFKKYASRAGDFHGYTYGYIRRDERLHLIGSLSEKNGFTIINTRVKDNQIIIEKDCTGLHLEEAYQAFDLIMMQGDETTVFDQYFKQMGLKKPTTPHMSGWTSWYNYYQNINEELITKNLDALSEAQKPIDIFQIDDGYQTFVGDWLDTDPLKFPQGMKSIANRIHDNGYKAGIWLAPFVCETNSKLFREKQEWLLRDAQGDLVLGGSNWSRFYALDLELPEVRAYLRQVFDVVFNQWGYDLVKLDFLYAACLIPRPHKTRGQLMCEAMQFLRDCAKDKLILACGVPLGPSFGLVDYCRIGCDVGLDWDDKPYMRLLHRERISTLNAIGNAIGRRHLNQRAFINDPDVFLLRDNNILLTPTQKDTLAFVNKHFGGLIFTSDDISYYTQAQHQRFDETMTLESITITQVKPYRSGLIEVFYMKNNISYIARINLSSKLIQGIEPYQTSTQLLEAH